jgi:hypothetical protein
MRSWNPIDHGRFRETYCLHLQGQIRFGLFLAKRLLGSFSGTEDGVLLSKLLWNSIVTRYVTHQKIRTPRIYRLWEPQIRQRSCSSHRIKRTDSYVWDNSKQLWRWYIPLGIAEFYRFVQWLRLALTDTTKQVPPNPFTWGRKKIHFPKRCVL